IFRPELARRDIVPLQEKMLGFPLEDRSITVYLVHFARPHGIKVTGNRFLTEAELAPEIVLRTAIHEMMHPPFDRADDALWAAVKAGAYLSDAAHARRIVSALAGIAAKGL